MSISGRGSLLAAALLFVVAGACQAADTPAPASSMIGPKSEAVHMFTGKTIYRDAHGKTIDGKTFGKRASSGQSFKVVTDKKHNTRVLELYPAGQHPKGSRDLKPTTSKVIKPGQKMPAFRLETVDGSTVTDATLRGQPVLVNFFFAECHPCIAETPDLTAYHKLYPHMRVYALTFEDKATTEAFIRKYKFNWPVIYAGKDLIDHLGVKAFPMMALFDADGRLIKLEISDSLASKNRKNSKDGSPSPQDIHKWVSAELAKAKVPARH